MRGPAVGGAAGGEAGSRGRLQAALVATAAAGALAASGLGDRRVVRLKDEAVPIQRVAVAVANSFKDGEMREVRVPSSAGIGGDALVLVAYIGGKFYVTGASCSHYSASLASGVLVKDRMEVVCPWHDAAFDLRTGQPVRGPGLQAIPTYTVEVQDGYVVVDFPVQFQEDFVTPRAVRRGKDDERVFVVIGGGAAGVAAADALRQQGFTGRVVLIMEERRPPYDRTVLSKNLAKDVTDEAGLRNEAHFKSYDIEVVQGAPVVSLDATAREISLATGATIKYDAALVATGAQPRILNVPGANLPEVMALRTPEDAQRISRMCDKGQRVVVIGSSFIGMEIAATLRRRGCEVTVLGMESVPFERVLGPRLGEALQKFSASKGVEFLGSTVVNEIRPVKNKVAVVTGAGKAIPCDAVIMGVGVVPRANFVQGVEKAKDGSLITDECFQTSAPGLFAAGDVATYRSPTSGQLMRVEHWTVAASQGRVAAKNMAGERCVFDHTPFFWTSLFGRNLRYAGHCVDPPDETIVDGNLEKLDFVIHYCCKGAVCAVATMGRDPVAVAAGELLRMGKMPTPAALKAKKGPVSLVALLREVSTSTGKGAV